MFNNNTYNNIESMLILWWLHTWELFGSQIPVTRGGFELRISCIWSNYLTHLVKRPNRPRLKESLESKNGTIISDEK